MHVCHSTPVHDSCSHMADRHARHAKQLSSAVAQKAETLPGEDACESHSGVPLLWAGLLLPARRVRRLCSPAASHRLRLLMACHELEPALPAWQLLTTAEMPERPMPCPAHGSGWAAGPWQQPCCMLDVGSQRLKTYRTDLPASAGMKRAPRAAARPDKGSPASDEEDPEVGFRSPWLPCRIVCTHLHTG